MTKSINMDSGKQTTSSVDNMNRQNDATTRPPNANHRPANKIEEDGSKRNSIIKMADGADLDLDGSDAEESFVFRTATTRVSPTPHKNSIIFNNNGSSSNTGCSGANLTLSGSGPSQCSTTSEINSDDDAVSLASRLSQIVHEEQSKQRKVDEENNRINCFDGDTSADASGSELDDQDEFGAHDKNSRMRARSSTFKLERDSPSPNVGSNQLPEIQVTRIDHNSIDCDRDQLDNITQGDQHELVDLPIINQYQQRNNDRLPERGNIKVLQMQQQQQQQQQLHRVRSNTTSEGQQNLNSSLGPYKNQNFAMHSPVSNTSDPGDLNEGSMLNIRRSTWTLSEFDDTYNKESGTDVKQYQNKQLEYANSNTSPGGGGDQQSTGMSNARSYNKICSICSPNVQDPLQLRLQINQDHCHHETSGQNNNLLVKANMNNHLQCNHQGISINPNTNNNGINFNSSYLEATGATSTTLTTTDHDKERRPSFTNSIVSFATTVDTGSIMTPVLARRMPWSKNKSNDNKWKQGEEAKGTEGKSGANKGSCCDPCSIWTWFVRYIPIFEWLPNYSKNYLYGDFMAGLAVAVLNISTSLSAAVVAETNLGVAFKTSIVNTFIYAILCSSRHTSFGSYSIMSQMLLVSVQRALSDELIVSRLNLGPTATWKPHEYERWHLNIIVMFTFLIGLIQLVCGLLKLGYIVASFIPEALSSSMIAATAFTMAIGQLANMCGTTNKILWSIEKNTTVLWADLKDSPVDITDLFANLFRWIQQIALLIRYHEQINIICVLISAGSVAILFLNQYFIQKQLKKYFKRDILIPIEMILLVIMIAVSYFMDLEQTHQVPTCGPIEIDFKVPDLPNLRLIRELWFQSLATALISYTTVHIMSKTYSNKCNYEVDSNQELIACGAGNLIGGLVDAMPAAASFSRTAGQVEAGGKTQMASIVNCVVLLLITYCLGHHVSALPVSVMAATLFYGFLRMMTKMTDVYKYWRICKVDFSIWVVSFIAILATDLVTGFVYGFVFSIITILYRAQNRRCYMLGPIPGSPDVFVPLVKYPMAAELDGIKIFQFCGPINYVSEELFESLLRSKTRVNVKQILKSNNGETSGSRNDTGRINMNIPSHIILDFSMISFIDSSGLNILKKIIEDYQQVNIQILIASMASHVARIVKNDSVLWSTYKNRFYVTLSDAVQTAIVRRNQHIYLYNRQQLQQQTNVSKNHIPT